MKHKRRNLVILILCLSLVLLGLLATLLLLGSDQRWKQLSPGEQQLRLTYIETAQKWLGSNEADGSHQAIIDRYNDHHPLPQSYAVKYTDSWCATFVSAVSIECGLTDIIPKECGCQRQIGLFQELGRWEEDDRYKPLPGDIIYYCRSDKGAGDCTGWSDHVGIVAAVYGPLLKVIEGNYKESVTYRYILVNAATIRGYGLPDYQSKI